MDSLRPASMETFIGRLCKSAHPIMNCDAVALPDLTCFLATSLELDFLLEIDIYCILCLFYLLFQYIIFDSMCFILKKHTVPASSHHLGFQFCNFLLLPYLLYSFDYRSKARVMITVVLGEMKPLLFFTLEIKNIFLQNTIKVLLKSLHSLLY